MTKRAAPVRRRRRLRLADVPVAAKLALVLVVPFAAVLALVALVVAMLGGVGPVLGRPSGDPRPATALAAHAADVVDKLQRERLSGALILLYTDDVVGTSARAEYVNRAAETDASVQRYRAARTRVDGAGPVAPRLGPVDAALATLPAIRADASARPLEASASGVLLAYRQLIGELVRLREVVAGTADVARAGAWLTVARESLALAQLTALRADAVGSLSPAAYLEIVEWRGVHRDAMARFSATAEQRWQDLAADAPTDPLDALVAAGPPAAGREWKLPGGPTGWVASSAARLQPLRAAEEEVDRAASAEARAARDGTARGAIAGATAVLATLVIALGLALYVGRSMTRSLRQVRTGAWRVANERLPQMVATLRDPDAAATLTAQRVAQALGEPLPVAGRDEIGQVAEAVNAVHREAARTAAEQAALRTGVSTMFTSLARRNQRLVDAVIGQVDALERHETNPERLAALFELDHLVTRMRRAGDSLLVLAGTPATRLRDAPVGLLDVVRAALSEVEDYRRVEYGMVDDRLTVAPHAVDGLMHLLAELIDNATRYSPPEREVTVEARPTGEGALVRVADAGIGVAADALAGYNRRLASPQALEIADAKAMGFAVVARLAARLGASVRLEPGAGGGTVAEVRVPADVVLTAPAKVNGSPPVPRPRPRPLEREPEVDLDHAPTVVLQPDEGAGAEREAADREPAERLLPRRTPMAELMPAAGEPGADPDADGAPPDAEEAQQMLSAYQHALGRYGHLPLPSGSTGQWEPE